MVYRDNISSAAVRRCVIAVVLEISGLSGGSVNTKGAQYDLEAGTAVRLGDHDRWSWQSKQALNPCGYGRQLWPSWLAVIVAGSYDWWSCLVGMAGRTSRLVGPLVLA